MFNLWKVDWKNGVTLNTRINALFISRPHCKLREILFVLYKIPPPFTKNAFCWFFCCLRNFDYESEVHFGTFEIPTSEADFSCLTCGIRFYAPDNLRSSVFFIIFRFDPLDRQIAESRFGTPYLKNAGSQAKSDNGFEFGDPKIGLTHEFCPH